MNGTLPRVGVDRLDAGAGRQAARQVAPHARPVEAAPARPPRGLREDPERPHGGLVGAELIHEVPEDGLEVVRGGHLQPSREGEMESKDLWQLGNIENDPSGQLKPSVDLVPKVVAADEMLL